MAAVQCLPLCHAQCSLRSLVLRALPHHHLGPLALRDLALSQLLVLLRFPHFSSLPFSPCWHLHFQSLGLTHSYGCHWYNRSRILAEGLCQLLLLLLAGRPVHRGFGLPFLPKRAHQDVLALVQRLQPPSRHFLPQLHQLSHHHHFHVPPYSRC